VNPVNDPPVADPNGPYLGAIGELIAFDGTGSFDLDVGDALTFEWDWGDGSLPVPGATPNHAYAIAALYNLCLTVTDPGGLIDTGCTWAIIGNHPPIANAGGPYTVDEGSTVTLDGSGSSDPDGDPLIYEWDVEGDGVFDISSSSPSLSVTYPDGPDEYTVVLRVSDAAGETDTDTATVNVNNVPPWATFNTGGPVNEGDHFTLSLTGAFDVGSADVAAGFEYAFDCGDGSGYGAFSSSSNFACPTDDSGTLNVGGKIQDKDGGQIEYSGQVNVFNVPPSATFSNDGPVDEGTPLTLTLSDFTDPSVIDFGSLQFAFDCGYGAGFGPFSSSAIATCATPDNGLPAILVQGKVQDKDGGVSQYTEPVTVNNVPPVVTITDYPTDLLPAPADVTVDFSFFDPGTADVHTATCFWSDGIFQVFDPAPSSCTRTGLGAGVYTVTVTVTDDDGGSGVAQTGMIVVFDSSGGFVTGGGWIDSSPGAYYPATDAFFDGSFYELVYTGEDWLYWEEAKLAAEGRSVNACTSAHLATITSEAEQAVIAELMGPLTFNAWVGGYQEDNELGTNLNWNWVGDEPWVYNDSWAGGEPNDTPWGFFVPGSEQHLEVYQGSGLWNDAPGDPDGIEGGEGKHFYIVEYEGCDPGPTGKATFGFVSKYKKGAAVPTGSTEFQFHAAGLNFHSNSYDWLVVTGSDYAMFKGWGTVNGEVAPVGEMYRFRIWAGDGDPDTFRIKIWYEDDAGVETVVYDNGFDQALGGGSIVIHTKKK
jgi:PKD repeat protein